MQKFKVGIVGITGRMGAMVKELLEGHSSLVCCGGICRNPKEPLTILFNTFDKLTQNSDVIIDFSSTSASLEAVSSAAYHNKPIIIGTTGFSQDELEAIKESSEKAPILLSANFSTGINVMAKILALVAPFLRGSGYDIEVHETHHRAKKDAPSGTALTLCKTMEKAIGANLSRANDYKGPRQDGSIGISFSRMGGVIGNHTVSFASSEEVIEISHKAINRKAFASGALLAAQWIIGNPNGLYSMEDVLNG